MGDQLYYSARVRAAPLSLDALKAQVVGVLRHLRREGYFQEHLGLDCPSGFVPGRLGPRPLEKLHLLAGRAGLFPVEERWRDYGEPELFDVIELLHDHVSRPTGPARWHDHPQCGPHHLSFDREGGRAALRRYLAPLLARYGGGFRLDAEGRIGRAAAAPEGEPTVIDVRYYEAAPAVRAPARAAVAVAPAVLARRAWYPGR